MNLDEFLVRNWFDKIDVEAREGEPAQLGMFLEKKAFPLAKGCPSLVSQMCQQAAPK